ncbi:VOC family protein [Mobilicoccus massiliensis]|uniref:VOC family protein n=1 Tax=Mobilicoccus massiliensis TaxID=1522310 RepID=UPI00058F5846|nr:VOC family protein [Mobilicoccus massiliensis]
MANVVHHIELWTRDLGATGAAFHWLFTELGWREDTAGGWSNGRIWQHPSGVYVVLEASAAITGPQNRHHAGLNHLALRVGSRADLDHLRQLCGDRGWAELFPERYPHAGGPTHTALFIENAEGFEIELVADE